MGAEKMAEASLSTYRLDRTFATAEETIAMSTMYAANHMEGVKAMIALTESGRTALMMSRLSSGSAYFRVITQRIDTESCCALSWGNSGVL